MTVAAGPESSPPLLPARAVTVRAQPTIVLAVFVMVLLAAFWPTWVSFPPAWWENRVHAFALVGLAFWMLWRARESVLRFSPPSSLVIVPLGLLSLGWAIGSIVNVQLLHQSALPVLLFGWWYAIAGLPSALAVLPAFCVVFLTAPVWGLTVVPLQSLTVFGNSLLLALTSLEAKIEGTYIAIPAGVFEVARGCSGANYFEAGVVISVVYAVLFLKHWRARFAAVALGAFFAMVSNWIRVFGLIIIGQVTEMQSPLIKNHNGYGWVIFAVMIAIYFSVVRRIERYDERLGAIAAPSGHGSSLDDRAVTKELRLRSFVAPSLALFAGPLLLLPRIFSAPIADAPAASPSVAAPAPWVATPNVVPAWTPSFSGAQQHIMSVWSRDSVTVQLDRFVYSDQAQGAEMIGAQNVMAPDSMRIGGGLAGPLNGRGRMANASVLRFGGAQWLAWQWYRVAGIETHSSIEGKLLEVPAWFIREEPSELIVVSTVCEDRECSAASKRLLEFVVGPQVPVQR